MEISSETYWTLQGKMAAIRIMLVALVESIADKNEVLRRYDELCEGQLVLLGTQPIPDSSIETLEHQLAELRGLLVRPQP